MDKKLQTAFEQGLTLPYDWLQQNNLLDELPTPYDDGWKVPKEKWADTMFYYCDLKMWIYRPEES